MRTLPIFTYAHSPQRGRNGERLRLRKPKEQNGERNKKTYKHRSLSRGVVALGQLLHLPDEHGAERERLSVRSILAKVLHGHGLGLGGGRRLGPLLPVLPGSSTAAGSSRSSVVLGHGCRTVLCALCSALCALRSALLSYQLFSQLSCSCRVVSCRVALCCVVWCQTRSGREEQRDGRARLDRGRVCQEPPPKPHGNARRARNLPTESKPRSTGHVMFWLTFPTLSPASAPFFRPGLPTPFSAERSSKQHHHPTRPVSPLAFASPLFLLALLPLRSPRRLPPPIFFLSSFSPYSVPCRASRKYSCNRSTSSSGTCRNRAPSASGSTTISPHVSRARLPALTSS